jgi:uncharacterized protein Smg (DUF494 family)
VQRNLEEIISYMENKFRPYEVFEQQMKQITRELMELGYTLEEITRGVNAYLLQLEPKGSDVRYREKYFQRVKSFRILDPSESRYIGRDAYGYLCLIRGLGLIGEEETEDLINYITDNKIEVEDGEQLQSVMMDLVLDDEGEEDLSFTEDKNPKDKPPLWHNFRNKRLH